MMDEVHHLKLSIHPSGRKMYHVMKRLYWRPGIKRQFLSVQTIRGSRQNIRGHRDCINLWRFLDGNGMLY